MEVSFVNDRAASGVKAALVKNAAGIYAAPTSANTAAMLSGSTIDAKGFVTFDYKQTKNTNAYPIVAITYALGKTAKSAKNALVAVLQVDHQPYAPASLKPWICTIDWSIESCSACKGSIGQQQVIRSTDRNPLLRSPGRKVGASCMFGYLSSPSCCSRKNCSNCSASASADGSSDSVRRSYSSSSMVR
jgi:hypothetical protein